MKRHFFAVLAATALFACNDSETKTTTDSNTDSSASMNADTAASTTNNSTPATMTADSATSQFLMKAADGGMAEVSAGEMAQNKATHADVKMFASMMVQDHTGANQQVKTLSSQRQVMLPAAPSEEHTKKIAETSKMSGKAFDKAYMDMMVADHKKTIALFQSASGNVGDAEVKTFITQTLPKLQTHLDSAQAIRKRLQ